MWDFCREYCHHWGACRGVCGVYGVSAAAGEEREWEEDGVGKEALSAYSVDGKMGLRAGTLGGVLGRGFGCVVVD